MTTADKPEVILCMPPAAAGRKGCKREKGGGHLIGSGLIAGLPGRLPAHHDTVLPLHNGPRLHRALGPGWWDSTPSGGLSGVPSGDRVKRRTSLCLSRIQFGIRPIISLER
jgi:hypothetical protein